MGALSGEGRGFSPALAGALALHLLAGFVAFRIARDRTDVERADRAPSEQDRQETEIALVEDQAPAAAPLAMPPGSLTITLESKSHSRPSNAPAEASPVERDDGKEVAAESYTLDPSAPPGSSQRIDLGIESGAFAKWGASAAPSPGPEIADDSRLRRTPVPASTTGGLLEALESQDRQLGLGPEGAVLSAAREAGTSEVAPLLGTAQFAVTVHRTGNVVVTLSAANGDAPAWAEVGRRIAMTLRDKPPRIKTSRRGVHWTIEVAAEERWPDGAPVKSDAPRPIATLPTPRSTDAAKVDLEKRNPAAAPPPGSPAERRAMDAISDAPGVFVAGRNRLGDYAVGVGVYGDVGLDQPSSSVRSGAVLKGNVDPTNLVGRRTRTVSARVIAEAAF